MGEACDERLGMPVAEGGMVHQAFADRSPTGGLYEAGLQGRLIDKDQSFQNVGHVMLAGFDPDPAPLGQVWPQDFAGEQSFSYA